MEVTKPKETKHMTLLPSSYLTAESEASGSPHPPTQSYFSPASALGRQHLSSLCSSLTFFDCTYLCAHMSPKTNHLFCLSELFVKGCNAVHILNGFCFHQMFHSRDSPSGPVSSATLAFFSSH